MQRWWVYAVATLFVVIPGPASAQLGSTAPRPGPASPRPAPAPSNAAVITKRVEFAPRQGGGGLGTTRATLTASDGTLPELRIQLIAKHRRGPGMTAAQLRVSGKPDDSGHVFAMLLPSWKVNGQRVTVANPRPQPANGASDGLGHHNSADTFGVGPGGTASAGPLVGGGESLFVWDDSGDVGIANAAAVGGAGAWATLQAGLVFQFTNANSIRDLNGTSYSVGASAWLFGLNYIQGKNMNNTPYWGFELMVGPSVSMPPAWPLWLPSLSGQASTTSVVGLSDMFWEWAGPMNNFFSFQSFPF